jgi:hypothetical protein
MSRAEICHRAALAGQLNFGAEDSLRQAREILHQIGTAEAPRVAAEL